VMSKLKELQVIAKSCGSNKIFNVLTDESILPDIRHAYGRYIFDPSEVLAHRSMLSYRINKILRKKGILWSADPLDVSVTRILVQVSEHVARQSSNSKCRQPVTLPDVSP
jgi:hypothetical protein